MEDIAAADALEKGMKPGLDERWHRLWGNPDAVLGPNGTVEVRRAVAGQPRSAEQQWRELFAATALWEDIYYDTYNGTYPHLYALTPEERPVEKARLDELRWKEEDSTLTAKEAEELWWAEQLHYDTVFGVFPGVQLPTELAHVTTRIIYSYIRLHPRVTYSPDMHAILAPLLYVALRDPVHGVRDSLVHRERSVMHRRLDSAEAAAFQSFHALASQVFRHWQPDPETGLGFVSEVSLLVESQLREHDPEMAHNLFSRLKVKAEEFVSIWVTRLFADQFPLWLVLPIWESILCAPSRAARVAGVCCAIAVLPAGRAPLSFAPSSLDALLLLRYRPAIDVDALLLAADAFTPPPPSDSPPSFAAFSRSLSSAREMRQLRAWAKECEPRGHHHGRQVTHVPYVNADGSAGFRKVGGGGFGYGVAPNGRGRRAATRFSRSKTVIPRLRVSGSDKLAPLNFSALIQHFPPPPDVDWRAEAPEDDGSWVEEGEEEEGEEGGMVDGELMGVAGGKRGEELRKEKEEEEEEEEEEEDSSLMSPDMRAAAESGETEESAGAEEEGAVNLEGEEDVGDEDEDSECVVFPQYRYNAPTIGQHDIDVRVERQQIRADEYDAQREELRLEDEAELRELEEEEARAQHEDAVAG